MPWLTSVMKVPWWNECDDVGSGKVFDIVSRGDEGKVKQQEISFGIPQILRKDGDNTNKLDGTSSRR